METASPTSFEAGKNMQKIITHTFDKNQSTVGTAVASENSVYDALYKFTYFLKLTDSAHSK